MNLYRVNGNVRRLIQKSGASSPAFFISILFALFLIPVGCVNKAKIREELLDEMQRPSKTQPLTPNPSPNTSAASTRLPAPLLTASKEDVLDSIRRSYLNLKTVQGKLQIDFYKSNSSFPQVCGAHLDYEKPQKISVKAYKELVPSFFTLTANEGKFWFHVPRYNTVYTGDLNRLEASQGFEMQLDPILLETAFLSKPLEKDETAEMEEIEAPYYLISIYQNTGDLRILRRKLWINRGNLSVEKEVYVSAQGIPEIEFIRRGYTGDRYLSFPQVIEFSRLKKGNRVKIEFQERHLNLEIPYEKFKYTPPKGAVLEQVN